jgi:hypothetical protein
MTIIILIIIIIIILIFFKTYTKIYLYDFYYNFKKLKYDWIKLIDNNKLKNPISKKNTILIITFDNRSNIPYITEHNKNIEKYSNQWNIEYKFLTKCDKNVYWCKLYILLNELKTNNYDYVMWLDSDTAIKNHNINLNDILNSYDSDIIIGQDTPYGIFSGINAGVFIIKNSQIGISFMKDCINNFDATACLKKDNNLKGVWAGWCYEQGIMNKMISEKYANNTTLLNRYLIHNSETCNDNTFIMHNHTQPNEKRLACLANKKIFDNYYAEK